jgi:hypothetical protein
MVVALVRVPVGVLTPTGPVFAPLGTRAVISVDESTVKLVAGRSPNVTLVSVSGICRVIKTVVPTGPAEGENETHYCLVLLRGALCGVAINPW